MSELASDWIKVHDWHRMLCCDSAQGLLHTATCVVIQECQLWAGLTILVFFYFKILWKEKWNLNMWVLFASEYYSVSKIHWSVSLLSIKVNIQCLHSEIILGDIHQDPPRSATCVLLLVLDVELIFHLKLNSVCR